MDSPAVARSVHSRFLKFPCIIQNNSLKFSLAKVPKAADQVLLKLNLQLSLNYSVC